MPCWYYDKKDLRDTPSILDGISFETERRYRKEGARFIMNCGTQMGLGHNTMATGVVYFHRFYMFHSFKSFPRYVTACCCLFLAGKVEETPKKCRDIIKIARTLLSDNYFYSFGDDPKEEVMTLERILLQTIKFDLQVEHPYTFLLKYAKCFRGDQVKLQKMVQMAWNFVNDSLSTVVCLQWEPEIIAVALIHLASKLSKFTVVDWVGRQPSHNRWWDMFVSDVTMEILEDICHQVLDLYQPNQKEPSEANSPPQKPPSRADSPTPTKPVITTASTGSPAAKVKPAPATITTTTVPASSAVVPPAAELTNIQSIKSLANSGPIAPTVSEPAAIPTVGMASTYHNIYPPPVTTHQIHSLYNSATPAPPQAPTHSYGAPGGPSGVVPPPLPPAMGPYGMPPAAAWGGPALNSNSHYPSNVPASMPAGPSGGGGAPQHGYQGSQYSRRNYL
ncbi:PREDICTED: cyclin-K [Rhagoletis zephyria]|uniref:cyclin-K n=1 Tax=Rhagoletis zephyria TaxID=28612 RepID=UPI000811A233|nr:PREDICTED: cyclin-K [Rhagoletis zephyria]